MSTDRVMQVCPKMVIQSQVKAGEGACCKYLDEAAVVGRREGVRITTSLKSIDA